MDSFPPVPEDQGGRLRVPVAPVVTVSRLLASARLLIEREMPLVWVGGEISNLFRASSGHLYFVLKDATAQVRCTLWRTKAQRLDLALRDGMAVEVRASPSLYEAKGEFQLNVDAVRLAGPGALYERFLKLKARLEAQGWFAPERKRALPRYPRCIGVVTSPRGAALRDVVTTLARQWPAARVIVYPAAVQGPPAVPGLVAALALANERAEADVLILCRGGGSIEDLWAFNEEAVARAVLESRLPVIAGIGHESDFTICDFVADLRAPTPTGAALLAAPDRDALGNRVGQLAGRIFRGTHHALALGMQRVDNASRRLVHPAARIDAQRRRLLELAGRLDGAWLRRLDLHTARLTAARSRLCREWRGPLPQQARVARVAERLAASQATRLVRLAGRVEALGRDLSHLSPRAVLERGYAIVTAADGTIVQDAAAVAVGDEVKLGFARGEADAKILRK